VKKLFYLFVHVSVVAALCLFAADSASAQGSFFTGTAYRYSPAGIFPASGASITVCTSSATGAPCTPKISLFADAALSQPVSNPLPVCTTSPQTGCLDGLGNFSFYASTTGPYVYSITGATLTPYGPIPIMGSNAFTQGIIAPSAGPSASQQHTLPAVASDVFGLLAAVQTFTNKTLNSPIINGSGGLLTLPAGPDTLTGRATTDTLTNKTFDISLNTLKTATNTAGHYPRNNGTQYVDNTIQSADVPAINLAAPGNGGVTGNLPVGQIAPGTNGQCTVTSGGATIWGTCTGTPELDRTIAVDGTSVNNTGTTTENTLKSKTINGGTLGADGSLVIEAHFTVTSQGATQTTFRLRFGGTQTAIFLTSTATTMSMRMGMQAENSTSSQNTIGYFLQANTITGVFSLPTSVDTTVNQTLSLTIQNGATTDNWTLQWWHVYVTGPTGVI